MKSLSTLFLIMVSSLSMAQESDKIDKIASVLEFQEELNSSFLNPETSPLTPEDRENFSQLDFFEIDTTFYVAAEFVRTPYEAPFAMPTTTDRLPLYVKYGEAYFTLNGEEHKLNLYQNLHLTNDPEYQDYLFLPFTDLTNGKSSYAGGRYVDMKIPVKGSDTIVIDFNKSYNPYCAYNGEYSCPIPPAENHLDLYVKAGVKKFKE